MLTRAQVGGDPASIQEASPKGEEYSYRPAGGGETMQARSDSSSNRIRKNNEESGPQKSGRGGDAGSMGPGLLAFWFST